MDPRERADAALARARARGAYVVTPDDAVSPMDAASTVQIPRAVVNAADQGESTMVIPAAVASGDETPPHGFPQPQFPQQQQPAPQQNPQQQSQQQQNGQQYNGEQYNGHYQSGHHQPVPRPAGHQSGPHQPVPPPQGLQQPAFQQQAFQQQAPQQQAPQQQAPQSQALQQPAPQPQQPEPEEEPTPRQLDGLVPTTQHPGSQRSLLSRRLDGN
jgi:hypothetical protein